MSSSDEDENRDYYSPEKISKVPYTTRSGRTTKPRYKMSDAEDKPGVSNPSGIPGFSMTDHQFMAWLEFQRQNPPPPAVVKIDAPQIQMDNPIPAQTGQLQSVLTSSSLPRFAGRKRPNDKPTFCQTQSFSSFLKDAEALMASHNITGDSEKIDFLAVLADKNNGDFDTIISNLRTDEMYIDLTYADAVKYLKLVYATASEKSAHDAAKSFLKLAVSPIRDRHLLSQHLAQYHDALNKLIEFHSAQVCPAANLTLIQGETAPNFHARVVEFKKQVIKESYLHLFVGGQLTPNCYKNAFKKDDLVDGNRPYHKSVEKVIANVTQTSLGTKCFVNELGRFNDERVEKMPLEVMCYNTDVDPLTSEFEELQVTEPDEAECYFTQRVIQRARGVRVTRGFRGRRSGFSGSSGFQHSSAGSGYAPDLGHDTPKPEPTDSVRPKRGHNYSRRGSYENRGSYDNRGNFRGGKFGTGERSYACYGCGQKGHFLAECPQKGPAQRSERLEGPSPGRGRYPRTQKGYSRTHLVDEGDVEVTEEPREQVVSENNM